jgi:hypothetical protein
VPHPSSLNSSCSYQLLSVIYTSKLTVQRHCLQRNSIVCMGLCITEQHYYCLDWRGITNILFCILSINCSEFSDKIGWNGRSA